MFHLAWPCLSQLNSEYQKLLLTYPDESLIILDISEKVTIDYLENKFKVSTTNSTECMYMNSKAGIYSETSVEHSVLEKITKLSASSYIPSAGGYKEIKVKDFKINDKISNTVFYDGYKSTSFLLPSLQAGAKSLVTYTKEMTEPRLLGSYFFQNYVPALKTTFSVTVPASIEINWKLFNITDSAYQFTKTISKNRTTYTWQATNIKKYKTEENAPSFKCTLPHINIWIKSYTLNDEIIPLLSNENGLYRWYYDLTKNVNKEESPELKKVVDSLTVGLKDELEKVKRVYYWVQDNIKYIAVEDGMGGFIPRSGKTVFDRRFGDCKDMASIITKMLYYANIKSYLTWIGTRSIPYKYAENPTPLVDNHMIATYKNGNDYYFLDATGRGTPYNMPTSFIQGKEALLGIDSLRYEIVVVPIVPATKNQFSDSVQIILEKNNIIGKSINKNAGYFNYTLSSKLAGNKRDVKTILKDYLNKSNNKFVIDSAIVSGIFDREKPVIVEYYFNIENYAQKNQDELYINLHLDKDYINTTIEPDRTLNFEREYTSTFSYYVHFPIPKGYTVEYLPPARNGHYGKNNFNISYETSSQSVVLKKSIQINELTMTKESFKPWNEMIKELKKAYSEVLILKKIK